MTDEPPQGEESTKRFLEEFSSRLSSFVVSSELSEESPDEAKRIERQEAQDYRRRAITSERIKQFLYISEQIFRVINVCFKLFYKLCLIALVLGLVVVDWWLILSSARGEAVLPGDHNNFAFKCDPTIINTYTSVALVQVMVLVVAINEVIFEDQSVLGKLTGLAKSIFGKR